MKCQNKASCKSDDEMEYLLNQLMFNQQVINGAISFKDLNDELDTRSIERTPIDIYD